MRTLIDEFPKASSTQVFGQVSKEIEALLKASDKETDDRNQLISIMAPLLIELCEKVQSYYNSDVGHKLKFLDTDMDVNLGTVAIDADAIARVCDALPSFNAADQLSENRLLPPTYKNFCRIAPDIRGVFIHATKCAEAVRDEFLDKELAPKCVTLATQLHDDKLRESFAPDLCDWNGFIKKFGESKVIQACKNLVVKESKPKAAKLLKNIEAILSMHRFDDFTQTHLTELKTFTDDTVTKDFVTADI